MGQSSQGRLRLIRLIRPSKCQRVRAEKVAHVSQFPKQAELPEAVPESVKQALSVTRT